MSFLKYGRRRYLMDILSYILARKYVQKTADALGAVKGAPCTVKSITDTDTGKRITLEWTGDSGVKQEQSFDINNGIDGTNGVSITSARVDRDGHIIIQYSNGRVVDAGIAGTHIDVNKGGISSLPSLYITAAVMPETKDYVDCEFKYTDMNGENLSCYGKIKCQGTSSMAYPKKNYTIALYEDAERTMSLKHEFKDGWGAQSKYCLKANYIDHSHMRNIISGNLWGEIVETRNDYDSLPQEMKDAYNHGAVDGYPFKLYENGKYKGIYTWNIPKDAWMFSMDKNNSNHVVLCAESNSHSQTLATACNFKKLWTGVDGVDWSIEVGTNSEDLITAVNTAIGFVMNATNEEFIANINDHFDLTNLIDYYILVYFINALDNLGKNMIMLTYDKTKWYLSPYDLDSTYGNFYDGSSLVSPEYACPQDYEEAYNHLFERLWDLFPLEIKNRYFELRQTVLTSENIIKKVESFYDSIGETLYDRDIKIFEHIPNSDNNNAWQIEDYMADRDDYVDSKFNALKERIPCTDISHPSSSWSISLGFKVPFNEVKTPANTTDRVFYHSENETVIKIDDYGIMTGMVVGDTYIVATCNGHSVRKHISVVGRQYQRYSITLEDKGSGWYENDDLNPLQRVGAPFYFSNLITDGELDIFMHDENGDQIGILPIFGGYQGTVMIPDPNCASIRIHLNDSLASHASIDIITGGDELTNSGLTWSAGILDETTGIITPDPTSHTWYSEPINYYNIETLVSMCTNVSYSYNYKGCVRYDWSTSQFLDVLGKDNLYRDLYEETPEPDERFYVLRLTATDMDLDTKTPLNKVRIFNFNKNYGNSNG